MTTKSQAAEVVERVALARFLDVTEEDALRVLARVAGGADPVASAASYIIDKRTNGHDLFPGGDVDAGHWAIMQANES
jgi:hypothetical protein